ncbi:unnamed protein product [Dicrocoelium dendriticum]|nr:unnamed protein product [Dicrocoelium dendriticum]
MILGLLFCLFFTVQAGSLTLLDKSTSDCLAECNSTFRSACERGCVYAYALTKAPKSSPFNPSCTDSCKDFYSNSVEEVKTCIFGCNGYINSGEKPQNSWFSSILDRFRSLIGKISGQLTFSQNTAPETQPISQPDDQSIVTRIRIFYFARPEESEDTPRIAFPVVRDTSSSFHSDLQQDKKSGLVKGDEEHRQVVDNSRNVNRSWQFACLLRSAFADPIKLLFLVTLVALLVLLVAQFVLCIHRQRRFAHYSYVALPTYAEAVDIKFLPCLAILVSPRGFIGTNFRPLRALRFTSQNTAMVNCSYEYVKNFEINDKCLPHTWIVVRIDGQGFRRFSEKHYFQKPNDKRALALSCRAAESVMMRHADIILAYGQSDEFSFVFRRSTIEFNRRASKLSSTVVSLFASSYVLAWSDYLPDTKLLYPPSFDSRVVLYPTNQTLRDYLSWRQVDCHVNNLYNTCFWKLVYNGSLTPSEAEERLRGTVSSDKNEILFSQFGCNYNNEPELFRKGTVIFRKKEPKGSLEQANVDIIGDTFWKAHPEILEPD